MRAWPRWYRVVLVVVLAFAVCGCVAWIVEALS